MSDTPRKLTQEQIDDALTGLDGWSQADGKLHKEFVFADFVEAFGFMAAAALCAERANHHPDWSNVYKKVQVDLTTHEAGGLTQLDVDLAREMNRVAGCG